MYSLTKSSYVVQGVGIQIVCENCLQLPLSNYFNSLYEGKRREEIAPLKFEIYLVDDPPALPADSIQAIKSPSVTSYSNGTEINFVSKNCSIVCLNLITKNAKGFLNKGIFNDLMELYSLIGSPFVETLKYHGLYFLHSAALHYDGVGYLVSGDGGCGKTTTSLNLVREGFKYVSDDSLLLEELSQGIIVHPLYTNFHIDQDLVERFPALARGKNIQIPEGMKVSVDISQIFPGSFVPYIRPDVIIFPKLISNGESQLYALSQTEVYRKLLKQTVLAVDKEVSRNQLIALEKLVKQTVGFELLSGRDIYKDPKGLLPLIYQVNNQNGIREKIKV